MKKVIFASAFALALAGCGGGNQEAKLAKLCKDDGEMSAAECDCMSKAAVDKLDGDMVNMLIKAAEKGDDDAAMQELMGDLSPEQMGQFMAFGMEIATTCEVG